jgi:Tfp pilus assembly protein PilE
MDGVSLIELIIGMWIVAILAFAPLAYFIYIFGKNDEQPFGKADLNAHKFEDSKYYDLINNIMRTILGGSGNADAGNAEPVYQSEQSEPDSSATDSSAASTPQSASVPVVGKGYGSIPVK